MINQFRQGDVLIERVDSIPSATKNVEATSGRTLLVRGEGRNHGHFATGEGVTVLEPENKNFNGEEVEFFLKVEEDAINAKIEHLLVETGVFTDEHGPIDLPAGNWKVTRQVEYDAYEKTVSKVMD